MPKSPYRSLLGPNTERISTRKYVMCEKPKVNAQTLIRSQPLPCHNEPLLRPYYQAIFAMKLCGYLLTMNLRPSSRRSKPMPKPMGKNQYSTGTVDVPSTVWNLGT